LEMRRNRFPTGLRPGPHWGSLQRSLRPLAGGEGARRVLPKNPTLSSALRASAIHLCRLPTPPKINPSYGLAVPSPAQGARVRGGTSGGGGGPACRRWVGAPMTVYRSRDSPGDPSTDRAPPVYSGAAITSACVQLRRSNFSRRFRCQKLSVVLSACDRRRLESCTVIICQQSYLLLFGIPSPTHSFIPGLKPSFLQILPITALPFSSSEFTTWIPQTVYCYF